MQQVRPLVTVAIPVYNGEHEIKRAIDSVLSQTYTNFELIILDDVSTDQTMSVVRSYADPRIRIVEPPVKNLGYVGNFNRAVEESLGEYLKILCHDDVLFPNAIKNQVDALLKTSNQGVVMCTGLKRLVRPNGRVLPMRIGLKRHKGIINRSQAIKACARAGRNLIGETSVVLASRQAFLDAGTFATKYTLDLNMWFRILQSGSCVVIDSDVSLFGLRSESGSANQQNSQAQQTIDLFRTLERDEPRLIGPRLMVAMFVRSKINQVARRIIFYTFGK